MIWITGILVVLAVAGLLALRAGVRWGSTADERASELPGDAYLNGVAPARVSMTRAISIDAPPDEVWPWIAQLGRGAGWYSIDWLDNARRVSARHLVSWIPEPRPGDATAIGYLRHIEPGRSLAWWVDGVRFMGARARLAVCYSIRAEGRGTRLISRIAADATGPTAGLALFVFRCVDSIMACRQLIGIRRRVQAHPTVSGLPRDPESGARDQYQLYEVIYADGSRAGARGTELAERWRRLAVEDGILDDAANTGGR
jgi:hypothetical protein